MKNTEDMNKDTAKTEETKTPPRLSVKGVSKQIKNKRILDKVDLDVMPQEAVGLLGPNGSGKSSLMKCISTAYKKDEGEITISGYEVNKDHSKAMESVGMCIENPALYPGLSGLDHLRLYSGYKKVSLKDPEVEKIIDYCNLGSALKKRTGTYSIGMKQRLAIGLALLGKPNLLLLDEPTNGLDPESTFQLRKLLEEQKKRGVSLLVTSHILGDLEKICDRFLFIKEGRIIRSVSKSEIKNHFHSYAFEVEDPKAASEILQIYLRKESGAYFEADFPDGQAFEAALKELTQRAGVRDVYRIESDLEALYKQIYGENQ